MRIIDARTVKEEVASGDFACPACEEARRYRRVRSRRVAHLYGVRLAPTSEPVEYLECAGCEATFAAWAPGAASGGRGTAVPTYEAGMLRVMAATVVAGGEVHDVERLAGVYAGLAGVAPTDELLEAALRAARARRGALWRDLQRLEPRLNEVGKERVVHAALFVAARDGRLERWAVRHVRRVARALGVEAERLRGMVAALPA